MRQRPRHTSMGRRTLRFERCESRRMLSVQAIDTGAFAPVVGESTLIFSSGLAAGWTPIDSNTQLDSVGQIGDTVTLNGTVLRTDFTLDLNADAFYTFTDALLTNGVTDSFYFYGDALGDSDIASPSLAPAESPDPIGAAEKGVRYRVVQPERPDDTPAPVVEESPETVAEVTRPFGMPLPNSRPLERVAMTPPTAGESPGGVGLIDLSALLIDQPSRTAVTIVRTDSAVANDTPAHDAAFAVESWVRALPRAATPSLEEVSQPGERTTETHRASILRTAPLSIDPTEPEATPADTPRVSAVLEPLPIEDRGSPTQTMGVSAERLDRSPAYRFIATLVSVMTVGGLVRAVRDEPVRRSPPAEHGPRR